MAETLLEFQTPVTAPDGSVYRARAVGTEVPGGNWHGWIEFTPVGQGEPLCSPRETTQPNRTDVEYWATGLTPVYLDGALARALKEPNRVGIDSRPPQPTIFGEPAPHTSSAGARDSIIDPFAVYANGEFHLRKQLGAMAAWHLVNIARDYELTDADLDTLNRMSSSQLIELIVSGVRSRAGR